MSYRDLRNFSEHMRLLGYPRAISLESFRRPNFPLLAELLRWLARRLEPEAAAALAGGVDSVEARVATVRDAAIFMATKANIKLNVKRVYGADGHAVRELLKVTSVLCAALAGASGGGAADLDTGHLNYDVSSKLPEIKQARQLATEITAKGAVLYELLAKEPEYKEIRERAPARQLDMAHAEACLERAAAAVRARTEAARESAAAAAAAERALHAKLEKRRGELERAELRLQSMQKIKPAYQGELAALEGELETLWDQYVLRHRCVEALKHQLSLVERAQTEYWATCFASNVGGIVGNMSAQCCIAHRTTAAEEQQAAVLQLIHKYEAEDVLGTVSDSDEVGSSDEQKFAFESKEPRPTTRPKTRLRIKTATRGGSPERRGVFGSMAGGGGGGGAGHARDELDDVPDEDDSHSDSDELSELARATSRYGARSTLRAESLLTRYSGRARAPPSAAAAAAARRRDSDDDDDFGDLLEGQDEDADSLGSSDESELVAAGAGGAAGAGRRAPSTAAAAPHDPPTDDEF